MVADFGLQFESLLLFKIVLDSATAIIVSLIFLNFEVWRPKFPL